jgi:SAM-dependent methyltransferase
MSRWGEVVTRTPEEARDFWSAQSLETLERMMAPRDLWMAWLGVAAAVVTSPGSVFEPGCGIGLLARILPEGCSYYGCDVNPAYVEEAVRLHGQDRDRRFEVRALEDVLDSGEVFDWVVVTSLFGMFPERTAYDLLPRFWAASRQGLSVTTMDRRLMPRHRLMRFEFTGHDPEEMVDAATSLPESGTVELRRGRELPQFRGHFWSRGVALYVWRSGSDRSGSDAGR